MRFKTTLYPFALKSYNCLPQFFSFKTQLCATYIYYPQYPRLIQEKRHAMNLKPFFLYKKIVLFFTLIN
jgi:hypothetical protein